MPSKYKSIYQFTVDVEFYHDGYVIFSPELSIGGGGNNLHEAFKDFLKTMIYIKKNLSTTPAHKLDKGAKQMLQKLKTIKRISR